MITIPPDKTVQEALDLMKDTNIRGLPVVKNGENLIGIVTLRDVRFAEDKNKLKVEDIITSGDKLVTAPETISTD